MQVEDVVIKTVLSGGYDSMRAEFSQRSKHSRLEEGLVWEENEIYAIPFSKMFSKITKLVLF